jgi:hypothetical protein
MAKQRQARELIDKTEMDLLKPLDVLSMGSEDDPCFGKHHDITAKECAECGDSEFCVIVKAQGLTAERTRVEAEQRFKDLEETDEVMTQKLDDAKQMVEEYRSDGYTRIKTILIVSKKLNLPRDKVKVVYDNL